MILELYEVLPGDVAPAVCRAIRYGKGILGGEDHDGQADRKDEQLLHPLPPTSRSSLGPTAHLRPGHRSTKRSGGDIFPSSFHSLSKNSNTALLNSFGLSSVSQCPQRGKTLSSELSIRVWALRAHETGTYLSSAP